MEGKEGTYHEGYMAHATDDVTDGIGGHGVIQRVADRALHLASAPRVHKGKPAILIPTRELGKI